LFFAVFTSFLIAGTSAGAGEFRVGREVFQKTPDFSLKDGDTSITVRGMIFPYQIRKIEGDRLYISALGKKGWAPARSVVLASEAHLFFSRAMQTNPSDSFAALMRGIARASANLEDQSALDDFNEAVRRDPANALAHLFRGAIRLRSKDLKNGLSDCERAVRLDPQNPFALFARGTFWFVSNDTNRATEPLTSRPGSCSIRAIPIC
jgi:tetratricopeptide (TPR) repeat protein